ncbi:MAG: response regulator transcription factor [Candidatus Pelagibacterales bacterium]|jgi:two-component system phosphate regulon response regulator OmpR|tara:strand:+ start:501 stop:1184 length:684 start_codon:yes stop_codon:yes gene_type:complete
MVENLKYHILIIDDDDKIRNLLKDFLIENKFLVSTAVHGEDALEKLKVIKFNILIVDIMMPGINGYELTKLIRSSSLVPIIHLTAMGDTENIIQGLELGADDYLSKPFEPKELLLRINNILKKTSVKSYKDQIQINNLVLNLITGEISGSKIKKSLNSNELAILKILSKDIGKAFSREELSQMLGFEQERTLDVCVNRLRNKIEEDPKHPRHLKTKRGAGYLLWIDS